jgi:tetratricopeptide (TPR) repeat protein
MRSVICWTAAILALVTCDMAAASEQSERLYSRGLVEFHAEHYQEALALFQQATQADPQDAYALYYKGETEGRLDDYPAAVSDLRAALAIEPDLPQAPLELGIALVKTGADREAVPWLEKAQQVPESDAVASLFLGMAQLHLGQRATARQQLERAARDAELHVTTEYYLGVLEFQEHNWTEADRHFAEVAAAQADSEMGREAAMFLERLRYREQSRLQLYGEAGFQYDSNVVVAPNDEALKTQAGISRQSDGRAILTAGGRYTLLRTDQAELTVGYEVFQSLHFHLHSFNLENHRPNVQFVAAAGPVRVGVLTYYDYYLLDSASFLQSVIALPWVEVPEGSWGHTQLSYRFRWRDYYPQPYGDLLSATNHAPGLRQLIDLGSPDRFLLFGYQYDREEPSNAAGAAFGYDGHQIAAGVGWALPWQVDTELVYAFRHEEYDRASAGRRDDTHFITLLFDRPINEYLAVRLAYFGTVNNSNDPRFEYDRNMVSLSLRGSLW